ncbi:unnamed protein product [Lasius platythorax]|uniref:Uncharacterized protein n=1 Tax=Lasius platythorax TaxID=488582 RepID=A0AAV2P3A4_9HYME
MSIDYLVDRIDRPDPVGETWRKEARWKKTKKRRKGGKKEAAKVFTLRELGSLILFFTAIRNFPARQAREILRKCQSPKISTDPIGSDPQTNWVSGLHFLDELKVRRFRITSTILQSFFASSVYFPLNDEVSSVQNQRTLSRNALTQLRRNGRGQSRLRKF